MPEPGAPVKVRSKVEVRRPDLDTVYSINQDGSRNFIQTHDVKGRWQDRKRLLWVVLIGVYLLMPWWTIDGKPALLLDIQHRQAHILGATFNASDFYLAFFIITGIGFTLFVVSSLLGRVWCGFGCPQTVFLEGVYRRVERWIEGPAAKRIALAQAPMSGAKFAKRAAKYSIFGVIALVITHTFLGYFMPVQELLHAVTQSPANHPTAFLFMVVSTLIVFFNFAWFREQLCIVICPYGRYQGTLYDRDTVVVGYDAARGEPRGPNLRGAEQGKERDGLGDCINCFRCVAVCPTGIDIRNGTQLECIGCANCIDACDEIMDKVGQPRGLVRMDSQNGLEHGERKWLRPRLFAYAFLFLLGCTVFYVAASSRMAFDAMVLPERLGGKPYAIADGEVRNVYKLRLVNKLGDKRTFTITSKVPAGVEIIIPSQTLALDHMQRLEPTILTNASLKDWDRSGEAWIEVQVEGNNGETLTKRLAIPLSGPE